ncbi:DUF1648 domain-containing protein [Streptomyces kunmingensis]|uniref:DUF1648 domain-containing protein n=1 Tax=Streptomyces kunmingensis TaxID=68225 RepID=A0ABU6CNV0_9ACTN|nr:DUF1648 domain-containing protein [Streptomyces kunmingensis]MEB3965762.1 DUF1648 domain-containing protein [Streptomyces kunmingensis]
MVFSAPYRLWLLPSVVLLAAMGVWGTVRYGDLPERIPEHIGTGGVDAWTDRSVGSAFLLVFLYAGVTVMMIAGAELSLRVTPRDELTKRGTPFGGASASLLNRPASRTAARRTARALLLFNACVGVSLLVSCGVLWRTTPDPDVPGWLPVALIAPLVVGTAATVAAAVAGRGRRAG